jgi:hypothetical protein
VNLESCGKHDNHYATENDNFDNALSLKKNDDSPINLFSELHLPGDEKCTQNTFVSYTTLTMGTILLNTAVAVAKRSEVFVA